MDKVGEQRSLWVAIKNGQISVALASLPDGGARRHTSVVCMAKSLKFAVRVLRL
jgi:hypothetical protein